MPGTSDNELDDLRARVAPERARYAGLWQRVAASALDGLLLGVITVLLVGGASLVLLLPAKSLPNSWVSLLWQVIGSTTIAWLYYATSHSSAHQATPGKRLVGIKVVDLHGNRIDFARATGRHFAYLGAAIPTLGLSNLPAIFTARRQALHDMMARTLVVSRESTPQDVLHGLEAPRVTPLAVVLASLALVFPAIVVIGTPALVRLQYDAIRSQVSSGLEVAAIAKSVIAREYEEGAALSEISSDSLGLPPQGLTGRFVSGISITAGIIEITYGDQALPPLQGQVVAIVPVVAADSSLVWICGHRRVPQFGTTKLLTYESLTTVPVQYLPGECRP